MLSKRAVETVRVLIKAIAFEPALGFAVYHKALDSLFLSTSKFALWKLELQHGLVLEAEDPFCSNLTLEEDKTHQLK